MTNLISIAILTRNGGDEFRAVLDAVAQQDCPVRHQLVILDSGSTDGTVEAARHAGAVVHAIPPEEFSFGESRDLLFSRCEGEVIATLSQDARPLRSDWLELLTRPIREDRADVVQGFEQLRGKPFFWDRIGKFHSASAWRTFFEESGTFGLSTVNLAVGRRAWEQTGFGPIPMCSDKLFQKRAARVGLRIALCKDALVSHGHDYDTERLFKRFANEGMALRLLGYTVGIRQTGADLLNGRMYRTLLGAVARGEVNSSAEILFPALRPLGIWYGNRFLSTYWR